jgi:arabinan endo-1,5-alpha-L-arabinosidase
MSFHWEADFDQGGRSTLAIHPLLWKNGWPYAGEQVKAGTYAILSERRGYSLELAVDFVRMNVARVGFGRPQANAAPPQPVAEQTLEQVQGSWPAGDIAVRCSDYMFRPWQKWQLTPTDKGTIAGPLFTIRIAGTNRALTATADLELTAKDYASLDEQLWRVEQLTDGRNFHFVKTARTLFPVAGNERNGASFFQQGQRMINSPSIQMKVPGNQ